VSALEPKLGDLLVWWMPQVPGEAFYVLVDDVDEAICVTEMLAAYDVFQFEHRIKPDYSSTGGLQVYEADGGEAGGPGWVEWCSENGDDLSDLRKSYDEEKLKAFWSWQTRGSK
jgi:hypothetical protein